MTLFKQTALDEVVIEAAARHHQATDIEGVGLAALAHISGLHNTRKRVCRVDAVRHHRQYGAVFVDNRCGEEHGWRQGVATRIRVKLDVGANGRNERGLATHNALE